MKNFQLIQLFLLFELELLRKKTRHAAGRLYLPKGVKAVAVDSTEYTRLNSAHIPADERFLYTYVHQFLNSKTKKKRRSNLIYLDL